MMFVSVIIPAFNEEKFIEQCLLSVKNQTFKQLEIIVVDDGSKDRTVEISKKYADFVINQNHLGCGRARNAGAKAASGEILVFIDADMRLHEECIEKLIAPITEGLHKGTCVVNEMVENPENKWSKLWSIAHNLPYDRRIPEGIEYMDTFRAVLKKEFLESGGYYEDRAAGEDKIGERTGFLAYAVKGAVIYHNNPDTFTRCMKDAEKFGRGCGMSVKGNEILKFIFKYSILRSVPAGIYKAAAHKKPGFIFFKIALDFMILSGFIRSFFIKKAGE